MLTCPDGWTHAGDAPCWHPCDPAQAPPAQPARARRYRRAPLRAVERWAVYAVIAAALILVPVGAVFAGGWALIDIFDATGASNTPGVLR